MQKQKMKTKQTNQFEWKQVPLGEILDYEQPTKYIVESTDYKTNYETPVLTAGKSFILGYTNETDGVYDKLPVIIFDDFTTENKFVDFKFKVKSRAMKLLRPKNDLIDLKYVFLAMQNIKFDMERHKRYYLSAYQFLKIPLPFSNGKPDLTTQQKIVAVLEKAEALKQKQKRTLELYDEYLKSVFWEMFLKEKGKWEEKSLSEVCEVNPKKSEIKGLPEDTEVSFLGMTNVGEKGELFHIQTRKLKEVITGFTYFKKKDVLFAKITPCMENGKGAIAKIPTEIGFGSTEFHVLRPNENILPEYIYFILSLNQTRKNAEMNMTGSAGQKRVPKSFFNIFKIPFPPISLQQKFASIVEKVEKLKEKQKKSLADSEELFNALMQKSFKGELS